jgi:hypothetical protein
MNVDQITESLKHLQEQLDEVLSIVKELQSQKRERAAAKKAAKTKPSPLTEEEITKYKEQFNILYDRWLGGDEVNVQNELEALDADELRRFADANNLNVTSKTPKPKCLQLIAARFREKRQLTKETPKREKTNIEDGAQRKNPADEE